MGGVGVAIAGPEISQGNVTSKTFWTEPEHILIILAAFLLAVALGGKGLGDLINKILRRDGADVTVNLPNGAIPEKCPVIAAGGVTVNPEQCVAHKAEHERSLRNEKNITDLGTNLHETRAILFKKLEAIEAGVTDIKVAVAGLVVKTNMNDRDARSERNKR